jgi:hypothetical protein
VSGYVVKGSNADSHSCSACGRTDLNRVIWLAPLDPDGNEGAAAPYGTDCAARLIAPKQAGRTAAHLDMIARSIAYIQKWSAAGADPDAIRSHVGVRFNVWASVEDGTFTINTPTGWTPVN